MHQHEAVEDALVAHALDRRTGRGEPRGVGFAFVAQRIVLGGRDQGRRQSRVARGMQRREARIERVVAMRIVMAPEPVHLRLAEQRRGSVLGHRWLVHGGVDRRVSEDLRAQRRTAGIACGERHGGGKVTARTVADDGDTRRIESQRHGMLLRPGQRRLAVFQRHRERELGRLAVLHREHRTAAPVGEHATVTVVHVEVHVDPAATVIVHQQRQGSARRRCVESRADRTAGHRDGERLDALDRLLVFRPRREQGVEIGPPLGRGQGVEGAYALLRENVQHHLGFGAQGHRRASSPHADTPSRAVPVAAVPGRMGAG